MLIIGRATPSVDRQKKLTTDIDQRSAYSGTISLKAVSSVIAEVL